MKEQGDVPSAWVEAGGWLKGSGAFAHGALLGGEWLVSEWLGRNIEVGAVEALYA
jgi:hypothetical protein